MKVTIIAEIGSNWEGNINKAKKLIKSSKEAGADAVKFQMWRANDLYNSKHPNWKEIKKSELTFRQVKILKKFSDEIKIEFFCSVFYPEAIDFLETLNVKRYKVASRTCIFKDPYSLEVLEKKSKTKKPIIISMGMGGDKKKIKNIFKNNKVIFCYCISDYPLNFKKINWKEALKFDGFSDHTMGITAPILFTILKQKNKAREIIIEKHVKLKESKGPDAATSIDTVELENLVKHVKIIKNTKLD